MASETTSADRGGAQNGRSWIIYVPDDSGAEPQLSSFLRLGARYDSEAPGALALGAESEVAGEAQERYGVRLQSAGEFSESIRGRRFSLTSSRESGEPIEARYTRPTASKVNRSSTARRANEDSYTTGERLDYHEGLQSSPQVGLDVRSRSGGSLALSQAQAEAAIADTAMALEAAEGAFRTRLPRLGAALEESGSSELRAAERISLTAAPTAVAESLAESRALAESGRSAMLAINAVFAGIAKGLAERRGEAALKDFMERSQAVVAMAQGIYGLLHLLATALGIVKMTLLREGLARAQAAGIHLTAKGVMLYARSDSGTAYINLSGGMITMAAPLQINQAAPSLDDRTAYDGARSERLLKLFERRGS